MLDGVCLNNLTMRDVTSFCEFLPVEFKKYDSGYESTSGLGFYCHDYESEDSTLDGVYIKPRTEKL